MDEYEQLVAAIAMIEAAQEQIRDLDLYDEMDALLDVQNNLNVQRLKFVKEPTK